MTPQPCDRRLYAYELEPDQVLRLLLRAIDLWPAVERQFEVFEAWLLELAA
ncbi:MAG: hypothetical protein R6W06_00095 [Prochlorococcaceae cyanobacterium]